MDYNVTHLRDWHRIRVHYYHGIPTAKRTYIATLFREKFMYHRAVFYEDHTYRHNFYFLYFAHKDQMLLFALTCPEAVYDGL